MNHQNRWISFLLFGILLELAAICLLIADPWIPIIDDVRAIVYCFVFVGIAMGIAGLISAHGQDK